MKKFLFGALAALALFAVSCDKNNTTGEGSNELSSENLVGTWTVGSENFDYSWVFTATELTINDGYDKTTGTYTVENGTIAYKITKAWRKNYETGNMEERALEENEKVTLYVQAKFLYGGSVMVYNYVLEPDPSDPYQNLDDTSFLLFKDGKKGPSDKADIQGTWKWYMHGTEKKMIRSRVIFNGSKFELIIGPWSEKYEGSFVYENGYVKCTITASFSGRNPQGEGWDYGGIDPTTLAGEWVPFDEANGYYAFYARGGNRNFQFPFVADGKVAYSILANLACKYEKQ